MTPLCRSVIEVNGEPIDCQRDAGHDDTPEEAADYMVAHLNERHKEG